MEVPVSTFQGKSIIKGELMRINASGRQGAMAGTKGGFELWNGNEAVVRKIHWSCPFWGLSNIFDVEGTNEDWAVKYEGANLGRGALGTITITANLTRKK
jgi:hypothetical protein